MSNIPQTTVRDLCRGKTKIGNASTDTIYNISKVLGVPMESLLEMSNDEYRSQKLHNPLYPQSAVVASKLTHNDKLLKSCEKDAIPEFKRFNIMEGEVRNVY